MKETANGKSKPEFNFTNFSFTNMVGQSHNRYIAEA